MGVACGPGFPLQVLALPPLKAIARSGLFTTIPNAALAPSITDSLHVITILSGVSLIVTRNDAWIEKSI
jgi:hypothetical protein